MLKFIVIFDIEKKTTRKMWVSHIYVFISVLNNYKSNYYAEMKALITQWGLSK